MTVSEIDHGMLFNFIMLSAVIWGIVSIIFLKPHRLIKKLVVRVFQISFYIKHNKLFVYHIVILWIVFYSILLGFLQMQKSAYIPDEHDSHEFKLSKLNKKWNLETMIWLSTIILISLISIYRNALLFTEEEEIKEKLKQVSEDGKGQSSEMRTFN